VTDGSLVRRAWVRRRELPEDWEARLPALQGDTGLSRFPLEFCYQRGLETLEAIRSFLAPRLESLKPAESIRDMDRAIARLVDARREGHRVRVFSDYDVDGTSGGALLAWFFRSAGFVFDNRQPDRFRDGYGLQVSAVEEASEAGVQVLVTVDCGISSHAAIERARTLGIDVIVVDHHQVDPQKGIPSALAVLNPQRTDCPSGLRELCGCALAFYLCRALRTAGRSAGWWGAGQEPNLKQHLDLVLLATAADLVPLIGDNHVLARHGMEVLRATRKPGLKALLEVAGIQDRQVSPGHLGFTLGPRINASGRMGSASAALELLSTEDPVRAQELAFELERVNGERAELQNRIWDEVRARIEQGLAQGKYRHGIVVGDSSWHEGVVGIVASRVTETFRKPAAVVALREDFGKGSVRSFGGRDVLRALQKSADELRTFGGHRHAAGLSVELDRFETFVEAFDRALSEPDPEAQENPPLFWDLECDLSGLSRQALEQLEALGPFGPGYPEPLVCVRASVEGLRVLKGRHLKLELQSLGGEGAASVGTMEGIWFHGAERTEFFEAETQTFKVPEVEFAGVPELNRFRGKVTPTLRIRECRLPVGSGTGFEG
jgi:single-stranded-DNA-specific exonuclease